MFWGLIMEPNKRYTQTVEKSFHVSMASLDVTTADDEIVQVMFCYDNRNYLLCSLKKGSAWQVPLDLNFQEGTKIAFTSNGRGHVHLTGYLIPDEDDLDLDDVEEEDDDEDIPQLVSKQSKRKALDSPKETKTSKRIKQEQQQEDEESLDDEHDDDDLDEDDSEDGIDEDDEEEVDDEEADDDEEDEEEEEIVEEEEEEVVETIVKPQKKNKQTLQQQQQQQQKVKQDKQKMVNGKELKQEQVKQKKNKGEQQQLNTAKHEQKARVIEGGVQIEDIKLGSGAPAKSGKFISVYYVGRLKNGKKFDSTNHGDGFKFRLGKGEVIKGWDIGIAGMKTGGKRRITIPPALAYGAKGSPPVIPGNSTLIFEVELRNVH
ncbi:46 kDa FK506-binding nuclear protein [Cephus cinctus]|uniref:FK506-binding protein n=1 Tax=Cephus cinctus TaxID=211228 RepID=A0AAJ7BGP0_CEPCN|nr:46 kDa FK506-binding nuclear protein [Cephus cinctus]